MVPRLKGGWRKDYSSRSFYSGYEFISSWTEVLESEQYEAMGVETYLYVNYGLAAVFLRELDKKKWSLWNIIF